MLQAAFRPGSGTEGFFAALGGADSKRRTEGGDKLEITVKPFTALTLDELYALLRLRAEVFVVEQNCPYQDLDNRDQLAIHVMLWEKKELLATLRVLPAGIAYPEVSIGRVVSRTHGQGHGRAVFTAGLKTAWYRLGADRIRISAQCQARGFYEKFGFTPVTETYLEDGIPHVGMAVSLLEQSKNANRIRKGD